MPTIHVIREDGSTSVIDAPVKVPLMEILRDSGMDELLASCGGCCSCATCHVEIEEQFFDTFPPVSDDENDLLDTSDGRTAHSRLSCQIALTQDHEGMRVRIITES